MLQICGSTLNELFCPWITAINLQMCYSWSQDLLLILQKYRISGCCCVLEKTIWKKQNLWLFNHHIIHGHAQHMLPPLSCINFLQFSDGEMPWANTTHEVKMFRQAANPDLQQKFTGYFLLDREYNLPNNFSGERHSP